MGMTNWVRKDPDELKKYTFFKQFGDSWKYSRGFRGIFVFAVILAFILGIFGVVPPFIYGKVVDDLTKVKFDFIYIWLIIWVVVEILAAFLDRILDSVISKRD